MKGAFIFIGFASAAQPSFDEWSKEYGFNSADSSMKAKYDANVADIEAWNADPNQSATFAVNQFSGMSFDEFSAAYLNAKPLESNDMPVLGELPILEERVSDVDWAVTPVKDQGQCGSCWAFGTMGSIEHVHKLKTGQTVSLSEQQLVDCDKQSNGCSGGRPDWAMTYLSGKPIYTTASYPYAAKDGTCKTGTASGVTVTGYSRVTKSEAGLESALANSAVSVMVYANSQFQSYRGGILAAPPTTCSLNHAVLATGYGTDFIKIKNSWGTGWGEAGYIRVAKTTAGCGPFGIYYDYPVVPTGTVELQV